MAVFTPGSVETQSAPKSAEEIMEGFKDEVAFRLKRDHSQERHLGKKETQQQQYRSRREQGAFSKLQMILHA